MLVLHPHCLGAKKTFLGRFVARVRPTMVLPVTLLGRLSFKPPGGRVDWQEAMALVCLPLAAPIGLSPLYIPTLCGPKRG